MIVGEKGTGHNNARRRYCDGSTTMDYRIKAVQTAGKADLFLKSYIQIRLSTLLFCKWLDCIWVSRRHQWICVCFCGNNVGVDAACQQQVPLRFPCPDVTFIWPGSVLQQLWTLETQFGCSTAQMWHVQPQKRWNTWYISHTCNSSHGCFFLSSVSTQSFPKILGWKKM